jgi:hypothetical protein
MFRASLNENRRTSAKHAEVEIQLSVLRLPEAARADLTFGRLAIGRLEFGEQVSRQQIINAADRAAQDAIFMDRLRRPDDRRPLVDVAQLVPTPTARQTASVVHDCFARPGHSDRPLLVRTASVVAGFGSRLGDSRRCNDGPESNDGKTFFDRMRHDASPDLPRGLRRAGAHVFEDALLFHLEV